MKTTLFINFLAFALLVDPLLASPAPSPTSSATPVTYEELPELKASDILKPEFCKLHEMLTRGSSIKVRIFEEREPAARWPGVPVELLIISPIRN